MTSLFAIMGIGVGELVIVMLICLLLFGSSKLPTLMRNLGRSAVEFKKGVHGSYDDDTAGKHVEDKSN